MHVHVSGREKQKRKGSQLSVAKCAGRVGRGGGRKHVGRGGRGWGERVRDGGPFGVALGAGAKDARGMEDLPARRVCLRVFAVFYLCFLLFAFFLADEAELLMFSEM